MIRNVFAFALAVIPCAAMLAGCPDETKAGDVDAHASAEPTPKATVPSANPTTPTVTATASATTTAVIEGADAGKADAAKAADAAPDGAKPKTK